MRRFGGKYLSCFTFVPPAYGYIIREFKYLRVIALHYIFTVFHNAPPISRIQQQVLRLMAVSIWMLNSNIYRPPEFASDKSLTGCCALQYPAGVDDWEEDGHADGDEELEPALNIRGAYFVADIYCKEDIYYLPSLRDQDWTPEDIQRVFGMPASYVRAAIYGRGKLQDLRAVISEQPKAQRIRRPNIVVREVNEEDKEEVVLDLNLDASGIQFASLEHLSDASAPRPSHPPEGGAAAAFNEVDAAVQSMLRQICSNIISVSPNRHHADMYCTLTPEARNDATAALFQGTSLPFDTVQIKIASAHTWDTTFFDRFFPLEFSDDPERRPRRQNFDKCSYFLEWQMIVARLPKDDVKKIRAVLLTWWRTLKWLPYSGNDRMWDTRAWADRGHLRLPKSDSGKTPSPRIAINERCRLKPTSFKLS